MKNHFGLLLFALLFWSAAFGQKKPVALAIHGGAGVINRSKMTAEKEEAYRQGLTEALQAGYAVLQKGGTSLDAVETAVRHLEDNPLFNAGKGAVFTNDGRNELDAAIMDGKTGKAGAVAGVTTVKNPISAARAVMEKSEHVLLVGPGADAFAAQTGLEIVPPSYFYTEPRFKSLQKAKEADLNPEKPAPEKPKPAQGGSGNLEELQLIDGKKYGTVGAVALDANGNLAAATSTGGMTNKRFGRVGDAPIIGAGTYADNATCAVSATGHGEFFIRNVVAYDVAALMKYRNWRLKKAANEVVMKKLVEKGGEGGLIAIDTKGNITMPFNSEGMFRASITTEGKITVEMYK